MSCIEGSPAARADIHAGDELIEINGMLLRIILTSPIKTKNIPNLDYFMNSETM